MSKYDYVSLNGKRYRTAERSAKVGEKVLIVDCSWTGGMYKNEDILTVDAVGKNGVYVQKVATEGNANGLISAGEYLVLEPIESEECSEANPDITDLLANLARRVSSLESQLSATQSNVEKLAEELANVKHLTESNEQDIAMLDERTQPTEEPVTPDESIPQYWAEALIRFYGGNR
jgi:hypothetical protein